MTIAYGQHVPCCDPFKVPFAVTSHILRSDDSTLHNVRPQTHAWHCYSIMLSLFQNSFTEIVLFLIDHNFGLIAQPSAF